MFNKILLLISLSIFGTVALGAEPIRLRWATPHEPTHVVLTGAKKFKEIVEKESKGEIVVDITSFRDIEKIPTDKSTGGVTASAVIEELKKGKFDVSQIYLADIAHEIEVINALRVPYLIKSHEHMSAVIDSKIGNDLLASISPLEVKGLGIGYCGGQEVLSSTGKIPRTPAEFKKLKVRPAGGGAGVEADAFTTLGSKSVGDSATRTNNAATNVLPSKYETYLPVYQKMIEGKSDLYGGILTDIFINEKLEPQLLSKIKAVIVPGMFYYTSFIIMDQKAFGKLSPKHQELVTRAGKAAAKYERDYVVELEPKMLRQLQDAKIQIVDYTPAERKAFMTALQPVYEKYKKIAGATVVDEIQKLTPVKDRGLSSAP